MAYFFVQIVGSDVFLRYDCFLSVNYPLKNSVSEEDAFN